MRDPAITLPRLIGSICLLVVVVSPVSAWADASASGQGLAAAPRAPLQLVLASADGRCGNGICEAGESARQCAADCSTEVFFTCGNQVCQKHESLGNCALDCAARAELPSVLPNLAFVDAAGKLDQVYMDSSACDQRSEVEWVCERPAANATIRYTQDRLWVLELVAKQALRNVRFPWIGRQHLLNDDPSDDVLLSSRLGGTFLRAQPFLDRKWQWRESNLVYPGQRFAPLLILADHRKALLVAAANWPPRNLQMAHAGYQMRIDYNEGLAAGSTLRVAAIVEEFESEPLSGYEPWHLAVLRYQAWLKAHVGAIDHPKWMWSGEGMLSVMLMNMGAFDASVVAARWEQVKSHLTWLQCWGQMSNYAAGEEYAHRRVPPLEPGEQTGCCLPDSDFHPRYLEAFQGDGKDLLTLIRGVRDEGYHAGFYVRHAPHITDDYWDTDENVAWMDDWITRNESEYGANAHYLDQLGRGFVQDAERARQRFVRGDLPRDAVIEGYVDVFPAAPFLSGYLEGGSVGGGPGVAPWTDHDGGTFINLSRLLMGDRLAYLGASNREQRHYGWDHDHWLERQIFLLGTKMQITRPNRVNGDPSTVNPYLLAVFDLHDQTRWWDRRPTYLDTIGLTDVPIGIDARRFRGNDGAELIAVDNPQRQNGATLALRGRRFPIPSTRLSVIEVLADGSHVLHRPAIEGVP
jgi:hypothetical protein